MFPFRSIYATIHCSQAENYNSILFLDRAVEEADKFKLQPVSAKGPCETTSTSGKGLIDSAAAKAEKPGAQDEGAGETEPVRSVEEREEDDAMGTGMNLKEKMPLSQVLSRHRVITNGKKVL